jgi:cell division control protein 7
VKHYVYELLVGLKNLKDLGIYHRDIKPGNFLYNPDTKRGMIIDFGLAEIDPKFQLQLEQRLARMKEEKKEVSELEENVKIYKRLSECLKIIGRNKIGTETYMPLESILHHSQQSYQSDIWPVGVILLQFVIRKYNIFNNVRMINKPNNVKNCYYINYIVELANFFGCQEVIDQCKNLGYELKLPKDIESFKFRDIANM